MSSGGDMDREEREKLREERLRERLVKLKPVANAWVREVSTRKEPPSQTEWDLWRELNGAMEMLR